MQTPGSTTAGSAAFLLSSLCRHHFRTSKVIAAKLNPVSTSANDSSGAPPNCAIASNGLLVWLKPTTPQGNPPNGTVDLSHSWAAQSAANQNGQPDRRRTARSEERRVGKE